jgi:uncharacterized 2Fe-2S/4Fe-4S cluster protein (DUF4445 family)
LLNSSARTEIEQLVRTVEKVETAADPGFQKSFVAAMSLPHAKHRFPNIEKLIPQPSVRRNKLINNQRNDRSVKDGRETGRYK